jgi:hypothetical protein
MSALRVELLWWEGCPSTEQALALIREALEAAGLERTEVTMIEVTTDEQARKLGFRGSPTILIEGADVVELAGGEDPGAGEPSALSCRLYRRRDGRISPTPDPADVMAAVAIAAEARALVEDVA